MSRNFFISKTLKQNLPASVSKDNLEIYITENGEIYVNTLEGKLIKCGSTLDNEDILEKISVDENTGGLLFDGLPICNGTGDGDTPVPSSHMHRNKPVLDKLSDTDGKLYYNNKPISSGSSGFKQFEQFTPDTYYSFGQVILHNNILYSSKKSFTSGESFDSNDWNVIAGDMTKAIYDKDTDGIIDESKHSESADFAKETTILRHWKSNQDYDIGHNAIYLNKIYTVKTKHTSEDIFNEDNFELISTGKHNELTLIDGGVEGEYYHLSKESYDILSNVTESNGNLSYGGKVIGDMSKNIYDKNKNGYVDYAENILGVTVTAKDINQLTGIKSNVQEQLNLVTLGMVFKGIVPTYADLAINYPEPIQGYTIIVEADEQNDGARTFYIFSEGEWVCLGLFQVEIRDFTTNPIDLTTEVTGILPESKIDPALLEKITDSHNHDNIDLLNSYDQKNSDIKDAILNKHEHKNKAILDTYNQSNVDLADAVTKKHEHRNKQVIDLLTESADGKLLFKGNLIQGSGEGGIKDLSAFTTNDLAEYPNKRYISDQEKAGLSTLPGIMSEQKSIKESITKIQEVVPSNASVTNKLVDKSTLDNIIDNINLLDKIGGDGKIKPNCVLMSNSAANAIIFKETDLFKQINSVVDSEGQPFTNVGDIIFKNLIGELTHEGKLELKSKDLYSIDLLDMPKDYENGKVLISNKNTMSYELADIGELTNSHENYTTRIDISDWVQKENKYEKIVTHDLNSNSLIVAMYDSESNSISLPYKINSRNEILITSDNTNSITVVINCSQGVVGNGTGSGGAGAITSSDFIDDNRVRTDKTYSSSKITKALEDYAKKSNVYSKIESDAKYSLKDNEHSHGNYNTLQGFSEDIHGNVYFKSKRILTDFNPFMIKKGWESQNFESLQVLVNIRDLFTSNNINVIMGAELLIQNIEIVSQESEAKDTRLVITEDGIITLDVLIEPSTTQKYILGINPDTIVMVEGNFNANLCINAY